jgi:hypothetical protein
LIIHRIESITVPGYVGQLIFTFFLGVIIEGINYFRYRYQANAYAELAKKENLSEG